jgi:hypothetical protein
MNEDNENETITEILDFTKPAYEFKPKEHHDWRQRGPYLVCKSCEIEHASYIGMEKILVGLNEEGQPILKKR